MTVVASVHYKCACCGIVNVYHSMNHQNVRCWTCSGEVEFVGIESIATKEAGGPWVKVEGEEMLKLLIFKMLPEPPNPTLASSPS